MTTPAKAAAALLLAVPGFGVFGVGVVGAATLAPATATLAPATPSPTSPSPTDAPTSVPSYGPTPRTLHRLHNTTLPRGCARQFAKAGKAMMSLAGAEEEEYSRGCRTWLDKNPDFVMPTNSPTTSPTTSPTRWFELEEEVVGVVEATTAEEVGLEQHGFGDGSEEAVSPPDVPCRSSGSSDRVVVGSSGPLESGKLRIRMRSKGRAHRDASPRRTSLGPRRRGDRTNERTTRGDRRFRSVVPMRRRRRRIRDGGPSFLPPDAIVARGLVPPVRVRRARRSRTRRDVRPVRAMRGDDVRPPDADAGRIARAVPSRGSHPSRRGVARALNCGASPRRGPPDRAGRRRFSGRNSRASSHGARQGSRRRRSVVYELAEGGGSGLPRPRRRVAPSRVAMTAHVCVCVCVCLKLASCAPGSSYGLVCPVKDSAVLLGCLNSRLRLHICSGISTSCFASLA